MKNFISKIKTKRLKGNVSLLIIFILLAGSVIALLSINQIQRLLTYGNMTFNYFRAFYIAKAGTELGLTEVYHREAGFQQTINSGDAIVTDNLVGIYTGFNPSFNMTISGNFKHLVNDVRYSDECKDKKIVLGSGEGIVLSLFRDKTSGFSNILGKTSSIDELSKESIEKNMEMEDPKWEGVGEKKFIFGLFSYKDNGDMENIVVKKDDDLHNFLKNINGILGERRYLTIKNPSTGNSVASFCIDMGGELIPYSDFLITVQANYSDMEVGLQSVVKNEIPSWSLNLFDDPK